MPTHPTDPLARRALAYLSGEPLLHISMSQVILRGTAEVLAASERGVLLLETVSEAYMLAAQDRETTLRLLELIPRAQLVVAHQSLCLRDIARRFGLSLDIQCHQAALLSGRPFALPASLATFRPLTDADAAWVLGAYSHGADPAYVHARIAAGEMLGAFVGDAPAGFIGLHAEGSLGMLEVEVAYRRRGIGESLVMRLSNDLLRRGRIPFSQIQLSNQPSRALHEKLGFTISKQSLYWFC